MNYHIFRSSEGSNRVYGSEKSFMIWLDEFFNMTAEKFWRKNISIQEKEGHWVQQ